MRTSLIIATGCIAATLAACATYKTTLTNEKGQSITCEASGHSGIITGSYLRSGYEACLESARAHGFSQLAPNSRH